MARPMVARTVWLPILGRVRNIAWGHRFFSVQPPISLTDVFSGNRKIITQPTSIIKSAVAKPDIQRAASCQPQICLQEELFCKISDAVSENVDKVSVVGAGMVGIACANSILFQQISSNVAIVDVFPKKLEGEGMDFVHGSSFINNPKISYDTDLCITANSKVVIITAGARQKKNESRLDLVQKNVDVIKSIIPPLLQYSPDAVFVIVSNPVDVLTWVTWKCSGLPLSKIIGSGTHLDSGRFQTLIAQRIGISTGAIQAFIVGEHGDSQVPLWSGVNVGGVLFREIIPNLALDSDESTWKDVATAVRVAGKTVRCLKGYSNTAIGLAVADIVKDVLRNAQSLKTVSTLAKDYFDICEEVFLSMPCIIGESGISQVVRVRITDLEKEQLKSSAKSLHKVQQQIKL